MIKRFAASYLGIGQAVPAPAVPEEMQRAVTVPPLIRMLPKTLMIAPAIHSVIA